MGFVSALFFMLLSASAVLDAARIKAASSKKQITSHDQSKSATLPNESQDGPRYFKFAEPPFAPGQEIPAEEPAKGEFKERMKAAETACVKKYVEVVCDPKKSELEAGDQDAFYKIHNGCAYGCAKMWCGSHEEPTGRISADSKSRYTRYCEMADLSTNYPDHASIQDPE